MEKKRKAKPMTAREKKDRARIRKKLREEGIMPPKKKPLNRKAFCNRARSELEKHDGYDFILYPYWALSEMLEKQDVSRPGAIFSASRLLARQRWCCWLPDAWSSRRRKPGSHLQGENCTR